MKRDADARGHVVRGDRRPKAGSRTSSVASDDSISNTSEIGALAAPRNLRGRRTVNRCIKAKGKRFNDNNMALSEKGYDGRVGEVGVEDEEKTPKWSNRYRGKEVPIASATTNKKRHRSVLTDESEPVVKIS